MKNKIIKSSIFVIFCIFPASGYPMLSDLKEKKFHLMLFLKLLSVPVVVAIVQ